jgi:alkanesulfonate monooxygenase SsuD/methylene tetrahydromethanopterin reductase-like flavin-dependent oxidoreductase (luciferase family)
MSAIGAPMHERAAAPATTSPPCGPSERTGPGELGEPVVPLRRRRRPSPARAARRPRIIVGGHTPAAYRRAVGSGHGWYGFALTPDATATCVAGLKEAADAVERPVELGSLEITVTPRGRLDAAGIEAFAAAGVDRLVMNTAGAADPDTVAERMQAAAALF